MKSQFLVYKRDLRYEKEDVSAKVLEVKVRSGL